MKMAESENKIQRYMWKILDDYANKPTDETTKNIFYNETNFLGNISLYNYKENEGINVTSKPEIYYTTVYASYPSGILWFGAICCVLFAIIGTTGNLISILALLRCKRLRNATTAFIVNLCVADMLYCCFTMPLTAVTFIDRDWKNGDALCKLFALVKFSNGIVSIFTVVAITINRYVLIVHHSVYRTLYSARNTGISIACLWLLPLTLISLPLFNVWGALTYNPEVGDCGVNDLNGKSPRALIFLMIIVVPSILFIGCYLKIYFVVKNSLGSKKTNELAMTQSSGAPSNNPEDKNNTREKFSIRVEMRDKKEFRVLRIVLVIFIFYFTSIFPISLVKLFHKEGELPTVNVLAYIFYFLASVINPIIYIAMSREYRMAYKELFTSKIC